MKKLDKKNIREILALTPMQEGMLFHYLKNPKNDHYFEQLTLGISGEIDFMLFTRAWNFVVAANEMLRTVFRWEKLEKPTQVVLKQHAPDIRFIDLSTLENPAEQAQQFEDIKIEDRKTKLDPREVPFRVILCKISNRDYYMVISNHHILIDGWSSGIILKEFFQAYETLQRDKTLPEVETKTPFSDFIGWGQNREKDKQKRFWEGYLKGYETLTQLPIKRKNLTSIRGEAAVKGFRFVLEKGIAERFDRFLKDKRVTTAAFFYCAWGILLQKYCGSDDVVFGTTVSGRSAPITGIENMVGLFINTLPLRVSAKVDDTAAELLMNVNDALRHREKYETTPLVEVKEYSGMEANRELFDTLMVIENYPLDHFLRAENKTSPVKVRSYSAVESTNYDLNIAITLDDGIDIRLIYNTEYLAEEVIYPLSRHFTHILMEIIDRPGIPCHAVDMLSRGEKIQLLADFNSTAPGYPADKTLHGLFTEQVKRTPDHVALTGVNRAATKRSREEEHSGHALREKISAHDSMTSITYSQLGEQSEMLARYLLEKKGKPGDLVGMMTERSIEMMVGILGILKAGCAYVPLNPHAPHARNRFVLADCNIKLLLSNCLTVETFGEVEVIDLVCLVTAPAIGNAPAGLRSSRYVPTGSETSLAYVIYTSGSTGKPRGVPISHANLSPLVHWGYSLLGMSFAERSVQNLSYYFDWSVWEMFITLTTGGVLFMVPGEVVLDSERYLDFICCHAITVLHITPTHFQSLLHISPGDRLRTLRYLCIGAEKLSCDLVERSYTWIHEACRVFNMYGPTEATIMAAVLEIDKSALPFYNELSGVPIGETLGNTILMVLDRHLNLCPLYVPGELHVGGDGVSRGYLNNPELTVEKFLATEDTEGTETNINKKFCGGPGGGFSKEPPGRRRQKIYKTGDLARWLPEGIVEFLGRIDQQVKIRGFRIEPGEIENHLLQHEEIKEALIIPEEYESGDKYLCAYIIPNSPRSSHLPSTLKEYLSGRLPDYMVPTYFILLEKMPLNPNGKVDVKALPGPLIVSAKEYIAPRDDIERSLAAIWAGVLGMDAAKIGIDDDFFELGGHSLNVTSVIGRIHKELKIEIPFTEVFISPTIREMSAFIAQMEKGRCDEIPAVEEREYYPLSSAQKRLFVLQQMETGSTAYNMCGIMEIEGHVEKEKFEAVFRRLISRHESLRTSFQLAAEQPVQKIREKIEFEVEYGFIEQIGNEPEAESGGVVAEPFLSSNSKRISRAINHFHRPFDLSQAPLLRVGLIKTAKQTHLLIVDMHHIISDGASIGILVDDFLMLYRGEAPKPLGIRYRDYSLWMARRRENDRFYEQKTYWLNIFAGEIPRLKLPTDRPRPVIQRFAGAHFDFEISRNHGFTLANAAGEEKTTLFVVLLSLFYIFLGKLSNQEDIVVGTPVEGRLHPELSRIMGMFVNTLAVRNYPSGEKRTGEFIREVRDSVVKAFENQEYPFEELVDDLNLSRDTGRNPLFDAAFTLQEGAEGLYEHDITGLNIKSYPYDDQLSKFDLTFICKKEDHVLRFTVEYCRDIFNEDTIKKYVGYFKSIVSRVILAKDMKIGDIEIISAEEKQKLLFDFNQSPPERMKNRTIGQLFREQVNRTPEQIALVETKPHFAKNQLQSPVSREKRFRESDSPAGEHLSYHRLDERSEQLAWYLLQSGVKPGNLVGIMANRSGELIVGILAILKTGCGYVPLNPGAPPARNRYIMAECNIQVLLSNCVQDELNQGIQVIDLADDGNFPGASDMRSRVTNYSCLPPESVTSLAYVIFTSGSTGQPKGVPITHANLSPLLHWGYRQFEIGPADRTMQNLSYFFDWSVWEIFITLTTGAVLYITPEEAALDMERCLHFLNTNAITVLHITPTQYSYIANTGMKTETLRRLFIGAEKLTYDLVQKSFSAVSARCRVFNLYGPTEATIISAALEIHREEVEKYAGLSSIPIGKAVDGTFLLILDHYFNMCPVNITGELYIGGEATAKGYLNNPGLTAEKFLYRSQKLYTAAGKNKRLYRTGDLARWLPEGNVEYLGRVDHQVKIRGFRIELGEIESQILSIKQVKEAIVLDKETTNGDKYLCAYIVPRDSGIEPLASFLEKLKRDLSHCLPDYMIPSYFLAVEKLPLNPNGKVDRKALAELDIAVTGMPYAAPRNPLEKKLIDIWTEVLDINPLTSTQRIGIDDNFFNLGGHSLKAIQLTAKLHHEFRVKLPLVEIFKTPVIRGLAEIIRDASPDRDIYISLEPVEKKEYYPLSSAQKRIYALHQMDEPETRIAYNIPSVWTLTGIIDKGKFEEVFRLLILRHESLRTSFHTVKGTAVQRVCSYVEFEIEYHDAATENNLTNVFGSSEPFFQKGFWPPEAMAKRFIRPYDLSRAPLLRVGIIKPIKPNERNKDAENREAHALLIIDIHHIIADGLSIEIFTREFLELYKEEGLSPLRIQYKDYAHWQEKEPTKEAAGYLSQAAYWREQFREETPVLELPTDFPRPGRRCFKGRRIVFGITPEQSLGIRSLARERETTLYMVLLAIFDVLLAKITNQETIVTGMAVAGRRHTQLEHIVGMFVNTLVSINYPLNSMPFTRFLEDVKHRTLSAYENQDYPFEELVELVEVRRDPSRNPLFDVLFDLQPINIDKIEVPGLRLEPYGFHPEISKFDLMLQVQEEKESLAFIFEYSPALFKEETIRRFSEYFKKIVAAVLARPAKQLSQIEIISDADKNRILFQFNNTSTPYPREKSIHRLFEEEVEKGPDKTAVVYEEQMLSYSELNRQAGILADSLWKRDVKPGDPVGIMSESSGEVIPGVLGILKAGGAYLPIDPGYPEERINFILRDSGANVLVTSGEEVEKTGCINERIVNGQLSIVDCQRESAVGNRLACSENKAIRGLQPPPAPAPAACNLQRSLAYIIYTSGSTGRPKGVMVEHRNVVRLVKNTNFIDFREDDRVLQTGALEFDASTFEIWGALLNGLCLYLTPRENILNPAKLKRMILSNSITTIWFTSPLFNRLVQSDASMFTGLRNLLVGGDVLSPVHIEEVRRRNPGLRIINGYGPTENTTFSTTFPIDREYKERIPIGRPIANSTVYIVDKNDRLQPVGIVGELLLGGDGVSRGYLNNPELTVEKFLTKEDTEGTETNINKKFCGGPGGGFSKEPPGRRRQKVYRTGDFARWLVDGIIEFLGRVDNQVKIRGFRIETEEVENHLKHIEFIKDAVVLARKDEKGENYMCAYIVVQSREQEPGKSSLTPGDKEFDIAALKKSLSGNLPDYMVPAYFVTLEQIPLTANGKVNKRLLPEPQTTASRQTIAPQDEIEEKLVKIWSEVLNRDALPGSAGISVDADFFDLGGHSLKATSLISKIHKTFEVNIPFTEIFTSPTIREMAAYIKATVKKRFISIEPREKKEYYRPSSAQRRLFVLHRMDEHGIGYNIPSVWNLEGDIDKTRFEEVFRGIARRHESLRTSFEVINEEPVQRVHDEVKFEIVHHVAVDRAVPAPGSFIRPFDLSHAPLLRVGLVELPGEGTGAENRQGHAILMVDMHHIISDGASMNIIMKDFMILFNGRDLPSLRIQYKDFSEWQGKEQQNDALRKKEEFWLNEFTGEIPVLDLPSDYARPAVQLFAGAISGFEIQRDEALALKSLALKMGTTLYMMLLSIYVLFLSKVTNQEDIIVGTPVAGRGHADIEGIIGMFVNTLALRTYPLGEKTVGEFLQEVKLKTLNAFENQEYQYEDLVDKVAVNRDISRNPLFDTMFILQNVDMMGIMIPGLELKPYEYDHKLAKFDLTLAAVEAADKVSFTFEYSTKLFTGATVERFITYFKKIISEVQTIEKRDIKLSKIEIISVEGKKQVLFDFNHTKTDYPRDKTLWQLFAEQAARTPDYTSIVGQGRLPVRNTSGAPCPIPGTTSQNLTYGELKKQADYLANHLAERDIARDTIVGIMIERSLEMVIGIFAILKTGGSYLPIDPGFPSERIDYILKDSGTKILVTTETLAQDRRELMCRSGEIILMENILVPRKNPTLPLSFLSPCLQNSLNLAYIIYTSGSTGKPKGVLIEHTSVVNLLYALQREYSVRVMDTYLLKTSYIFDVSVAELFGWFLEGGRLAILGKNHHKEPPAILAAIARNRVTHINFVPSMFTIFLEHLRIENIRLLSSLKYIFLAGEALSPKSVSLFRGLNTSVILENIYGPTENTVYASKYSLSSWNESENIPIGKPLPNITLLVLNKDDQLQPLGLAGELCLGGTGLARGYLNRPELTAEKFVYPFRDYREYHEEKNPLFNGTGKNRRWPLYKTGDLAKWLPTGNVEFLGRIDHQVKIRGFRIELGEIERHISQCPGLKDAVVIDRDDEHGDKYLCAYFVSVPETPVSVLRDYLSKFLPSYMIPAYFFPLEKIPLNSSGKIARKELPLPQIENADIYVSPRDEVERKLVDLWSEVLKLEKKQIGIDDNFFHLGGHSLKASLLATKIHQALEVKLPLNEFFKKPTIRSLASLLSGHVKTAYMKIEPIEEREYDELSFNQRRLWIAAQFEPNTAAYNMPGIVEFDHPVEVNTLREVIKIITQRHDSLRTAFREINHHPVQVVIPCDQVEIMFKTIDIAANTEPEQQEQFEHIFTEEVKAPFDLSRPPLLRTTLIKFTRQKYVILFNMHHIISDGWSLEVLKREFLDLYMNWKEGLTAEIQTLPPIKIQYKDYTEWQNKTLKNHKNNSYYFWKEMLEKNPQSMNIPYDFLAPEECREGAAYHWELPLEMKNRLNRLSSHYQTSLFVVMLSFFNLWLALISGQKDTSIGLPVWGRNNAELHNIVGFFVNTLVFYSQVENGTCFSDFLTESHERVMELLEHQAYPLEPVLKDLNMKFPSINVFFNMLNLGDMPGGNNPAATTPKSIETVIDVKFDLMMYISEKEHGIMIDCHYLKASFKPATIIALMEKYAKLIHFFIDNPGKNLNDFKQNQHGSGRRSLKRN